MKLWIDDLRSKPGYFDFHAHNYVEAINYIENFKIDFISFDHDLGEIMTGYDIACHIESKCYLQEMKCPRFSVHSANPVGRRRIIIAMKKAGGEQFESFRKYEIWKNSE